MEVLLRPKGFFHEITMSGDRQGEGQGTKCYTGNETQVRQDGRC